MRFKEGFPSSYYLQDFNFCTDMLLGYTVLPQQTASAQLLHGCVVITEQRICADSHSSTMLPAIPTCGHQLNEQKFRKEVSFTSKYNVAWGAEWSDSCMHINSTNSEVVFMAFHELCQCASHRQGQGFHITNFLP